MMRALGRFEDLEPMDEPRALQLEGQVLVENERLMADINRRLAAGAAGAAGTAGAAGGHAGTAGTAGGGGTA